MSKVLLPNILITKDYKTITELFSGDKFITTKKIKSADNLFYLSTLNNKYLTSFEYDLNFNVKNTKFFTLKFTDTDGNFEQSFLDSSFLDSYLRKLINYTDFSNSDISNVLKNSTINQHYYIAFGIGDDITNWSSPHVCEFRGAEMQIDAQGRRIYTFSFTPSNDPIFRRKFLYDVRAVNPDLEFSFLNNLHYKLNCDIKTDSLKTINLNIRNLLEKYIKVACNTENVLVMLPDIDNYFKNKKEIRSPEQFIEAYSAILNLKVTAGVDNIQIDIPQTISPPLNSTQNSTTDVTKEKGEKNSIKLDLQFPSLLGTKPAPEKTGISISTLQQPKKTPRTPTELEEEWKEKLGVVPQNTVLVSQQNKSSNGTFAPPTKVVKQSPYYIIRFSETERFKSSLTPNIFDWHECLNVLFQGVATCAGIATTDALCLFEETDTKFLNLWYDQGVIKNNKDRCIVIGVRSVIDNYLYRNAIQFDKNMTFDSTIEFNPVLDLENKTLKNILLSNDYAKKVFEIVSRGKTSSAFSEKIILDELALNDNSQGNLNFIKFLSNSNILKISDTPIFMNNLKNSNIISINIDNIDSYFAALNFSVKTDFIDDLVLKAKQNYEKSKIYKITNQKYEDFIKKIIDSYVATAKNEEQEYRNNPISAPTPNFNDSVSLLRKVAADNKVGDTLVKYLYQTGSSRSQANKLFFSLIARELISSKNNPDLLDDVNTEVDGLSTLIESIFTVGKGGSLLNPPSLTLAQKDGQPGEKSIKASMFQYLYKTTSPVITIKTLPFFHLSNHRSINGKLCILLSKRTISALSPINSQTENLKNNLDFFSGVYNIIGAKHVITTQDCYSEFVIQKLLLDTLQ